MLGDGVCGYADLAGRADRCLIVEDFGLYWSAPSDLNKHLAALSAALRRSARHAPRRWSAVARLSLFDRRGIRLGTCRSITPTTPVRGTSKACRPGWCQPSYVNQRACSGWLRTSRHRLGSTLRRAQHDPGNSAAETAFGLLSLVNLSLNWPASIRPGDFPLGPSRYRSRQLAAPRRIRAPLRDQA